MINTDTLTKALLEEHRKSKEQGRWYVAACYKALYCRARAGVFDRDDRGTEIYTEVIDRGLWSFAKRISAGEFHPVGNDAVPEHIRAVLKMDV